MRLRRVNWKSSAVFAPRKLNDESEHKRGACRNDHGMVWIAHHTG
jgi:hypothetical protein